MAKKTSGATKMGGGASSRGMRPAGGRTERPSAARGVETSGNEPRGAAREGGDMGGRRQRAERGMLDEAGEMARHAGEATVGAARQAAAGVRDVATGVAGRTQEGVGEIARYVRDNPWPSLLIGAGATWMAVGAIRGRGESGAEPEAARGQATRGEEEPGFMRRAATSVTDASRGAGQQVEQFVRENPLVAGATALGVGLAVGMALPATMRENRMLGEARDTVVRRAKQAASGTVEAVRDVAKGAGRVTSRITGE